VIQRLALSNIDVQREIARHRTRRLWRTNECHQIFGPEKWRTLKNGLLLGEGLGLIHYAGLFGMLRHSYVAATARDTSSCFAYVILFKRGNISSACAKKRKKYLIAAMY